LEQDPERDWKAAIIFESASLLPRIEAPYQELLAGNRVKRIFLETLPEGPKSGLGLAIFKLVTKPKAEVLRDANLLVKRLKVEVLKKPKRTKWLDLIEFYQEARLDGVEKGIEEGIQQGKEQLLKELILRMAGNGRDAKQISDELGIELKVIRKILKSQSS
jgi:predicted transposase/invertase (TIGR01784 family)